MKIFMGWSGDISKHLAETLRDWLNEVMTPHAKVFVSSKDIGLGVHWDAALSDAIASANYGVLCVTPDNMNAQWMYYEIGQMEVAMRQNNPDGKAYIAPLLFGMTHSGDLPSPLSHYQSAKFSRETMWRLVTQMNDVCMKLYGAELNKGVQMERAYLEKHELARNFDRLYAELVTKIAALEAKIAEAKTKQVVDRPVSSNVLASPASETPTESEADILVALSRKMEDIYLQFGSYPEIARVYFEGRQIMDQFRDESTSLLEKGQDLVRFCNILNQAVDKLTTDTTDSNPNRRTRIRALRELRDAVEKL